MNIYGKLAEARKQFHNLKLKKSGKNSFAKYEYFELGDFVIEGMKCLDDNGLVPVVSFSSDQATMTVYETDGDGSLFINSPMAEANLKGCHPIQNLGAVETYQRRYLWVALLEIVEHDALDSSQPVEPAKPKAAPDPLATDEQKAQITAFAKAGNLSPRRSVWIKAEKDGHTNWSRMTVKHAAEIIKECEELAGSEAA